MWPMVWFFIGFVLAAAGVLVWALFTAGGNLTDPFNPFDE